MFTLGICRNFANDDEINNNRNSKQGRNQDFAKRRLENENLLR